MFIWHLHELQITFMKVYWFPREPYFIIIFQQNFKTTNLPRTAFQVLFVLKFYQIDFFICYANFPFSNNGSIPSIKKINNIIIAGIAYNLQTLAAQDFSSVKDNKVLPFNERSLKNNMLNYLVIIESQKYFLIYAAMICVTKGNIERPSRILFYITLAEEIWSGVQWSTHHNTKNYYDCFSSFK